MGALMFYYYNTDEIMDQEVVATEREIEATDSSIPLEALSPMERLKPNLERIGLVELPKKIQFLAFKEEGILEVYAKIDGEFRLLIVYPFTGFSGGLGPKLKQGDKQIPEGIYKIEYLNPNSSFHLSMKVSYPNKFDISKSKFQNVKALGGDIFIHGKAVTIGCIPIGDEAIEELFLLAKNALDQEIKVIMAPRDFRENPSFPEVKRINWEQELYTLIKEELMLVPKL